MKSKDRLKEEIAFDKLLLTIAFAIFSSMVGWVVGNKDNNFSLLIFLALLLGIFSLTFVAVKFFKITTKIKNLDYEQYK